MCPFVNYYESFRIAESNCVLLVIRFVFDR
ncbi:MAG: hypothetical protein HJJLKODD_02856 [Phycisphaerae bacterium]|nr:hypothetical protein [Phycisphaerae bacterium]